LNPCGIGSGDIIGRRRDWCIIFYILRIIPSCSGRAAVYDVTTAVIDRYIRCRRDAREICGCNRRCVGCSCVGDIRRWCVICWFPIRIEYGGAVVYSRRCVVGWSRSSSDVRRNGCVGSLCDGCSLDYWRSELVGRGNLIGTCALNIANYYFPNTAVSQQILHTIIITVGQGLNPDSDNLSVAEILHPGSNILIDALEVQVSRVVL
jgi:hypothetical protein